MRAAAMRDRKLVVADVPVPEPGPGEVLVRTLACGICGSDLHALTHADAFVATARRAGNPRVLDQLMAAAPRNARIVVVGVCMEADTIYPMLGIVEELSLQFVLGYTQEEFATTLEVVRA